MHILYTVINDLYRFTIDISTVILSYFIESTPPINAQSAPRESVLDEVADSTFKSVESVMAKRGTHNIVEHESKLYVSSLHAAVFAHPTSEFDGEIGTLAYGTQVVQTGEQGRYVQVECGTARGWVFRDDLSPHGSLVLPMFENGKENEVDDPNTVRLRAIIGDVFGGSRVEYPLQAGEYVVYRLYTRGAHISWPAERPRTPGRWHKILKGIPGIHIGVVPKTGAVMEYVMRDEIGHLTYIESVSPDGSIEISEANYPDRGIYSERRLTREEWIELRPIFIEVL